MFLYLKIYREYLDGVTLFILSQIIIKRYLVRRMSFISKQCSFYLNYNNSLNFLHYQTLSGIGFNKLGLYQECIAESNNQFYLVQGISNLFGVNNQSSSHVFMSGICFDSVCNANDLHYALGSFDKYIRLPFQVTKVQTPSLIEQTFDFENITVLTVISILIFLLFLCTLIDFLKKIRKINFQTKFVQIFSIFTTLKLLESRSQGNNQRVKTFSGLKALSLIGIMLTNIGIVAFNAPTTSIYSQTQNGSIFLSFYAVDIWLLVSGFFLSYLLLRQFHKLRSIKILILKIVRRFTRLWPIYILSLFIIWDLIPLVGSGPLWPLLIYQPQEYCKFNLSNIFMISNIFNDHCYNWLWLFQLDFQLCFLFVPILLLYIKKESKIARFSFYSIQIVLIACSLAVSFLLFDSEYNNLTDYFFHIEYSRINILPITRCAGFIIGYNLGIAYYRFKKSNQKNKFWIIFWLKRKICRVLLPLVGLLGFASIGYFFHTLSDVTLQNSHILYFTGLHIIIPVLITLLILPSLFGYQSQIKMLLESWICNFVSKLSITIYSTHFITTIFIIYYRQYDLELSSFMMIYLAFCTLLPSLTISIILTTIIQIPVFVCKKVFWKTERITYFEH